MTEVSANVHKLPANGGVISYLELLATGGGMVHPDITERLSEIKAKIPSLSLRRCLRSQILVHVVTQQIYAAAFGTGYAVKTNIGAASLTTKNRTQRIDWSDGSSLDLRTQFGEEWYVGTFDDEEIFLLIETVSPKT